MSMLGESATDPWWGGQMIWGWIGLLIYFAPTIVAVGRGGGGGCGVFFWNLVLGWTVWGWFLALLMAFGSDRRVGVSQQVIVNPIVVVHPGSSVTGAVDVVVSPTGNLWWDGKRWRDVSTSVPPEALRSPGGTQWWDGTSWRRVPRGKPRTPAVAGGGRPPDQAPWWERLRR